MKCAITVIAILLAAALSAPANADATSAGGACVAAADQANTAKKGHVRAPATRSSSNAVTYDRDSKDPSIGWHWQGGMRVCTQDCDNPEIPGSGYTCRNVNVLGMAMRECDSSN
jgi:hypothetical protein